MFYRVKKNADLHDDYVDLLSMAYLSYTPLSERSSDIVIRVLKYYNKIISIIKISVPYISLVSGLLMVRCRS